jgi:hypothetical protein
MENFSFIFKKIFAFVNQNLKKNPNIDEIQFRIQKKEEEVTKILGEIIKLKNELSQIIEKELNL